MTDISTIYRAHKLYDITAPFQGLDKSKLVVPDGFGGIAILYEYDAEALLPEAQASFLSKVIDGGMKLDPAKILIANLCYTNASLQKLAEVAKAKAVIVFGLAWLDGLHNANIRKNEIVKLYGMKVLITDSLDIINTSDAAKKSFWQELKKIA